MGILNDYAQKNCFKTDIVKVVNEIKTLVEQKEKSQTSNIQNKATIKM